MHIFFDFDQTLSKQHTVGKNHAQKSQEELRSNLKDADELTLRTNPN